ncbi:hypothetical protein Cfor_04939 [Coptotermes formosanus]|uniref:Uncharacterized protein n=1 Tax=Coptotermes formosanus TaxID=36987 RepID=A0A6L2PZC9_COPFO|nr:hypothetical protein Cfor_04939 [Coptotermes formosanus]
MTIDAFYRLVAGLSNVNFGDFDMIGKYFSNNTEDAEILNGLNVTFLMLQVGKPCDCVCDCAGSVPKPETLPWCRLSFILTVMFRTQFLVINSCKELFVEKCWWRNMYYDCCSLFELQKTEYGFCYSFNSETSEYRQQMSEKSQKTCRDDDQHCKQSKCSEGDPQCNKEDMRPRRTSTSGMWSGLRIQINTFPEHVPPRHESDKSAGVLVFVTSPYDFPVAGTDVTSGSTAHVSLSAQVTYTTPQVLDLTPDRRGCLYENESQSLGFPSYRHGNCIAQCHLDSTYMHCNCTPYFYPTEDVFNYEKPEKDNPYFDDGQSGMVCQCQADCDRTEYTSEFYVTQGGSVDAEDQILLDVHFKHPTVVLYRTDVVFGWLDLTVSLGGIAGLFIGSSLLSGAELIYYFTFRLYGLWRTERRNGIAPQTQSQKLNPSHTTQKNVLNSPLQKSVQKTGTGALSSAVAVAGSVEVYPELFCVSGMLHYGPLLHISLSRKPHQATYCHIPSLRFGISSLTPYLACHRVSDVASLTPYLACHRLQYEDLAELRRPTQRGPIAFSMFML